MSKPRKKIRLKTKLASALCHMVKPDGEGGFVKVIPYDQAKRMSEDEILSSFHWHHNVLHAHEGEDAHWNIEPIPAVDHRKRTAEIDIPAAAKVKRLSAAQEEFRRRILQREPGEKRPGKGKIPSRPFPSRQRAQA